MRNCDKIKKLEYELGRWKKKVADEEKVKADLVRQIELYKRREAMWSEAVDGTLAQVAEQYGETVEENGEVLGKRLVFPKVDTKALLEKYEVRARPNEDGNLYVGVVPKGTARK